MLRFWSPKKNSYRGRTPTHTLKSMQLSHSLAKHSFCKTSSEHTVCSVWQVRFVFIMRQQVPDPKFDCLFLSWTWKRRTRWEKKKKKKNGNADFFWWIGSSTYSPSGCWRAMSAYGRNNVDSALCFSRQWHLLSLPINVVLIDATEMKEAVSSFDLITVHYLTINPVV